MKYNLIGQRGKEGTYNPDSPEAGPYIYDTPPGLGDNKGLSTVRGQVIGPASKSIHEKKLKDAGITEEEDFSQFSFGEKEVPDVPDVVQKLTTREYNTIRSLDDIKKLAENRTFTDTQITRLKGIYGVDTINALFKEMMFNPEVAKLLVKEGPQDFSITPETNRAINSILFNIGVLPTVREKTGTESPAEDFQIEFPKAFELPDEKQESIPTETVPSTSSDQVMNIAPRSVLPPAPVANMQPPNIQTASATDLFPFDPTLAAIEKRQNAKKGIMSVT